LPKLFTYKKQDKLKSRKQTQYLFSKGQSIQVFPIKLIYTIEQTEPNDSNAMIQSDGIVQAGVGAPSRTFRKAVQRNRVKRLLREAYRLEKPNFINQLNLANKRLNLFFLYIDAQVLVQAEIQSKLKEALAILTKKIAIK
jgi:ribonuclease P protein component